MPKNSCTTQFSFSTNETCIEIYFTLIVYKMRKKLEKIAGMVQ